MTTPIQAIPEALVPGIRESWRLELGDDRYKELYDQQFQLDLANQSREFVNGYLEAIGRLRQYLRRNPTPTYEATLLYGLYGITALFNQILFEDQYQEKEDDTNG